MKTPVLYCDDGEERELPFKYVICSACNGHGTSSAYLGAFTADCWAEQDDEFKEDYIAGAYDRACDAGCENGKVKVPDFRQMSKADRKAWNEQQRELEETRAIERAERLFEGGWREEGWFD